MVKKIVYVFKSIFPSSGWGFVNFTFDADNNSCTFRFYSNNGATITEHELFKGRNSLDNAVPKIKSIIESYRSKLTTPNKWDKVHIKYDRSDNSFKVNFGYNN